MALLPEATLLMMEMMLSVIFPMLFGLNGEVDYWHSAAAEPMALLTVSLYAGTLALAPGLSPERPTAEPDPG